MPAFHLADDDESPCRAPITQLRLAGDVRHAIERDELRLHFQPILDCRTGALASLEALVRWQHPARGCLAPGEFFDAVRGAGMMRTVGHWVVAEACRRAVEWHETAGLCVPIDVNVSPAQLGDADFVARVLYTLRVTGAKREWIGFEVTEEIELAKDERPLSTLRDLRDAGFRVRIDDFGTGYSSLSYLQRLPIDGLKLDRAFLEHLGQDARRREVVSAIVRLAHVLHLDVVAEGVEREEQLEWLRAMGCDLVQGYLLSPPLASDDMRAWLEARAS